MNLAENPRTFFSQQQTINLLENGFGLFRLVNLRPELLSPQFPDESSSHKLITRSSIYRGKLSWRTGVDRDLAVH